MWFLSPCVALAGTLVIDSAVPVDVYRGDTEPLVRLYVPGTATVTVPDGTQRLRVWTDGEPHDVTIEVPIAGSLVVVVGKNGITTGGPPPVVGEVGPVEFRVAGKAEVLAVIDDRKIRLGPGDVLKLDLTDGNHAISIRDPSGTVVWAKGLLTVNQPRGLIVQLAEGRAPDVAGDGGRFVPDGK